MYYLEYRTKYTALTNTLKTLIHLTYFVCSDFDCFTAFETDFWLSAMRQPALSINDKNGFNVQNSGLQYQYINHHWFRTLYQGAYFKRNESVNRLKFVYLAENNPYITAKKAAP